MHGAREISSGYNSFGLIDGLQPRARCWVSGRLLQVLICLEYKV